MWTILSSACEQFWAVHMNNFEQCMWTILSSACEHPGITFLIVIDVYSDTYICPTPPTENSLHCKISSLVERHSGMKKWCHPMVVINGTVMAAFERKIHLQNKNSEIWTKGLEFEYPISLGINSWHRWSLYLHQLNIWRCTAQNFSYALLKIVHMHCSKLFRMTSTCFTLLNNI